MNYMNNRTRCALCAFFRFLNGISVKKRSAPLHPQHPRNGEACLFLIFLGMIYYRHTKPSVWDRRIFLVWYASHFRRAR